MSKVRADFMSEKDKKAMGDGVRTHENCRDKTGRNRPGKTAHDRSKREREKPVEKVEVKAPTKKR